MIGIKLGILLVGFVYAGLLPYVIRKVLQHIDIDLNVRTLSFLGNKSLYDPKYAKAYKRLLFAAALLTYLFFWLLSRYYNLGRYEAFMQYIDYSFALITLLAFIPHNIEPYSLKTPGPTIRRLLHNLLAVFLFLALPILIFLFQFAILDDYRFLGIAGLVIISASVVTVVLSGIRNGINGFTEILFINGISSWTIFTTIATFIR